MAASWPFEPETATGISAVIRPPRFPSSASAGNDAAFEEGREFCVLSAVPCIILLVSVDPATRFERRLCAGRALVVTIALSAVSDAARFLPRVGVGASAAVLITKPKE